MDSSSLQLRLRAAGSSVLFGGCVRRCVFPRKVHSVGQIEGSLVTSRDSFEVRNSNQAFNLSVVMTMKGTTTGEIIAHSVCLALTLAGAIIVNLSGTARRFGRLMEGQGSGIANSRGGGGDWMTVFQECRDSGVWKGYG